MQDYTTLIKASFAEDFINTLNTPSFYEEVQAITHTKSFLISLKDFEIIKYIDKYNKDYIRMYSTKVTLSNVNNGESRKVPCLFFDSHLLNLTLEDFSSTNLGISRKELFKEFKVYPQAYLLYNISKDSFKDTFFEETLTKIAFAFNIHNSIDLSLVVTDSKTAIKSFNQKFEDIHLKIKGIPVYNHVGVGLKVFYEYVLLVEALPVRISRVHKDIPQSENWIEYIIENTIKKMSF